ncbi:tRNA 2-thiouridine(34) synthase MnmA [Candidatus Kaiserbacteria bacterium RIFCSPHIGHO2_02_FULL_50_50]|uniref:tRNA-specific 2-thiouridylase MnmA n=1 Tax=Candidatus Kaiserbacteria bacterium RIFCSPHIGHO2_02_FULL_50_50 TaxID=1798492 RepID=A0A1F6DCK0_9BACT|nr:MAG: tRNA 2-thiouridine(34) synthase MnmA [Candidatus Kaiserbacteria bacterium RIFCSPHIGHO2_02_FULL_50_50]OGG88802.1 MAG: tRNA 2-thiouridine(34) synthase MnmA [Candidatus Kaiserbacteria bacterium RIFCSPLOWO2_12_FULL_50_10]
MVVTSMAKVFVGLSGGVDSSVSAHMLKAAGHEVVGVFIKTWQPDFLVCNWERERLDAMRVAASLEIPFLTCDAEEAYKTAVGEYMIAEYLKGNTPNPDVMCNRHVKFGVFWEFAKARGADFIATGHYAQVVKDEHGVPQLVRGNDANKDQSYFLWQLTKEDLAHTMFPIGHLPKPQVREYALANNVPVAEKKDSQGICFLGHVDIEEFLSHYTTLIPGDVLNENGEKIGTHNGALIYTYGQRHGFTIDAATTHEQPHYVIAKDLEANTVIVGTEAPKIEEGENITLTNISWVSGSQKEMLAQFRYRQSPFPVILSGETLQVPKETERPAKGQSVVFYTKEGICLGGAIVANT